MVINNNLAAIAANRNFKINTTKQEKSSAKLSSDYKINCSADNAAGLSISEKMRSQIRGLEQASTNAQDGISLIQTAEGALNEDHSILQRMRELTVQAVNDTNANIDRQAIQEEIGQLSGELDRISNQTEFNTQKLLDGSLYSVAQSEPLLKIMENLKGTWINDAFTRIKEATGSSLGAMHNRLEHIIANLDSTSENTTSAESRIRDVDMSKEIANYAKYNILQQASQAMIAQANRQPEMILQLLS